MIDFINVEKTYKSGVDALKGVSFTIDDGEFVFVIGKSGSGKSTLLKCITCEETPSSGKVTIDNFDISHMSRALVPVLRRKIGMIYQDFRLIESKTVAENVAFAGEIIGVPKKSLDNTVQICLSVVGLKEKANAYPQELSGGEQQRVAIARAMVNNPSLIIADEPTGNLDPETSEAIMAMLLEINRNGTRGNKTTIIICTHDQALVDRMKQRVIEIDGGLIARDEYAAGYKDRDAVRDAEKHENVSRTAAYTAPAAPVVSFGDDEAYSDGYDDAEYEASKPEIKEEGFVFGDEAPSAAKAPVAASAGSAVSGSQASIANPSAAAGAAPEVTAAPAHAEPAPSVIKQDAIIEEEALPSDIIEQAAPEAPQAPQVQAANQAEPEIIEINIPPEAAPAPATAQAPAPAASDFTFGDGDEARPDKKEERMKRREEKRLAKEEKRREKLDKKKQIRRTDFASGSDIDMLPEDDE